MKKNVECIARTINLSQPKTCARPSQIQKLINADVASPCPNLVKNSYKTTCRPVSVRICSIKDMQRTLAPELCECPQKSAPDTFGKILCRLVKNLAKSGIAAGFVYWTIAEGVWGDGRDTEELYHRIITTVAPAFEEAIDVEEINLPHIENMKHNLLDGYNRLILRIIGLIARVPIMFEEKINDVLFPCDSTNEIGATVAGIRQDKKKFG